MDLVALKLQKQIQREKQSDSECHGAENSRHPEKLVRLYAVIKFAMRRRFQVIRARSSSNPP